MYTQQVGTFIPRCHTMLTLSPAEHTFVEIDPECDDDDES